jgi:hypothetical protein
MKRNKKEYVALLTKTDVKHIGEMTNNEDEKASMLLLTESSKDLDFNPPSEINWLNIQSRIKPIIVTNESVKVKSIVPIHMRFFALAASTVFIGMGWLFWSNYQLHNQLEQLLLTNQQIELKLINPTINSYEQVFFVKKINDLDKELQNISSLEKKVTLLEKRSALVLELYKTQQGVSNVFSI